MENEGARGWCWLSVEVVSLSAMGYKSERPAGLPISAGVWDVAERYTVDGSMVAEAMFEAMKKLEAEVITLRNGNGNGLTSLLS